ncbi:hypothetical protein E3N88_31216 [Mikania micrantha]|uniref:Uncharacterized protein n=1 Tax=Mikania micrantha TaxID=192012 RepID=A0A5N6MPM2_9ASTR|nr:hypothetical protein E3N88_31216 [Mikania micrantha]
MNPTLSAIQFRTTRLDGSGLGVTIVRYNDDDDMLALILVIVQLVKRDMIMLTYSGCGGMSPGLHFGAKLAGVNLSSTKWAVDANEEACESLRLNHLETQIRNESANDFLDLIKEWDKLCKKYPVKKKRQRHDTVLAGPPALAPCPCWLACWTSEPELMPSGKHKVTLMTSELEFMPFGKHKVPDYALNFRHKKNTRCRLVGNAVAIPVGRALGYTLGIALQKLIGDEPLIILPPKSAHSTTLELLQSRLATKP